METKSSDRNIIRISAETYDLCVEKYRNLYGNNFHVISQKTVKIGGFLGFFQKEGKEVAFLKQPDSPYSPYSPLQAYSQQNRTPITQYQDRYQNVQDRYQNAQDRYQNVQAQQKLTGVGANSQSECQPEADFTKEKNKILAEAKGMSGAQVQFITEQIESLRNEIHTITGNSDIEHESISKIRTMLENNEFTPSFTRDIIQRLRKELTLTELEDFELVQRKVVDWIGEKIKIGDTNIHARPEVIILVGPTGVGKTTTVAKLTAQYSVPSKFANPLTETPLNLRLITIDTFRIAAKEQIETYGKIMEVPVDCIQNIGDLPIKIASYGPHVDIILVDTIGYSPKDYESIGRMRKMLDLKGVKSKVLLAMSASTKASDMRDTLQQYEIFGYESVIITKLDETNCVGNLISVLNEKNKALGFFTTGQNVPKDIEKASIIRLLIQLSEFKIDREHIEEEFSVVQ